MNWSVVIAKILGSMLAHISLGVMTAVGFVIGARFMGVDL